MVNKCCDVLERELDPNKEGFKSKKANGEEWIPAFLYYVNEDKCTGWGMCIKVCLGNCHKLQKSY